SLTSREQPAVGPDVSTATARDEPRARRRPRPDGAPRPKKPGARQSRRQRMHRRRRLTGREGQISPAASRRHALSSRRRRPAPAAPNPPRLRRRTGIGVGGARRAAAPPASGWGSGRRVARLEPRADRAAARYTGAPAPALPDAPTNRPR